jgi:hypothetical protein
LRENSERVRRRFARWSGRTCIYHGLSPGHAESDRASGRSSAFGPSIGHRGIALTTGLVMQQRSTQSDHWALDA